MRNARCFSFLAATVFLGALAACGGSTGPVTLLAEKDKEYVRTTLADMRGEVRVVLFSRDGGECTYCEDAEGLLGEIAAAEPRVTVETLSLKKDADRARELGIDKVPGIAIIGRKDYGLRYFGLPSGYEFIPFVETLRSVGNDDPELLPETVAGLGKLEKPVHLAVFVTQHWPYCPKSARVAYGMAMASDLVDAEVVDAEEFGDLAKSFGVGPVPMTVINGKTQFPGAAPEDFVLKKVLAAQ